MKRYIFFMMILALTISGHLSAAPVDLNQKISLQVEEVPLATVLQMVAQQYQLNIVQSADIDINLTLTLDNVSLKNALEAILTANGYNYYLSGDIIIVKPLEISARGETVTRTLKLDYISPKAATRAAENMLSPKGKIAFMKDEEHLSHDEIDHNLIVITDLPEIVDAVVAFIQQLDIKQPQVSIEVRMIETNFDHDSETGFKWPGSLTMRAHGLDMQSSTSTGVSGSSAEAVGQMDFTDGRWTWGKLSLQELNTVLDFLQMEGNSKLISDPKITTLNDHPAEIKVTTIVPIQTINRFSEGGAVQDIVTFQDEEVGITLMVTPHVTKDNEIILDVEPTVAEIIGYSGPADNQKPITSERTIKTKVTVKNGETVMLGGLLKENKIEKKQRVFLLGSIPILGHLFTHNSVQTNTTDLTILITPQIVRD